MAKSYKTQQNELSIEQQNAIELLLTGKSDASVADAVGVSRQTVWQWRNRDANFRAEISAKRAGLYSEHQDALRALVPEALAVLRQALNSEDERVRLKAVAQILRASALESSVAPLAQSVESIQLSEFFV